MHAPERFYTTKTQSSPFSEPWLRCARGHPDAGALKGAWMLYHMRTTNNLACGNRLLSWYVGGLNYQIEHHLFPRVCHVHYRQLSLIVQRLAANTACPTTAVRRSGRRSVRTTAC